jgi:hypothetical protein
MVEGGVGIPVGMEHRFQHGDLQPKKMKSDFWKRKLIPFGNS